MSDNKINPHNSVIIHRAPLIVPVSGPVIDNGAILLNSNEIIEVDRFDRINSSGIEIVDHEDSAIVPGLINCHSHLELSYLHEMGLSNEYFEKGDMTSWINELIQRRTNCNKSEEQKLSSAEKELHDMFQNGIVAVADIGNSTISQTIGSSSKVNKQFFLESFGLSINEVKEVHRGLSDHENLPWTGHAPYSASPELIVALKKRAVSRGELFPIHVAESADEINFLETGKGRFLKFLNKRLKEANNESAISVSDIFSEPGCGAVAYLDKLGVLDRDTLCVHAIHVNDFEVDLLAQRGASVCFCPTSNKFLGVGKAPVSKYLKAGVKTSLGTDSSASNSSLNLWHEMMIIAEDNPDVAPEDIFKMATINGSEILGIESSLGSLAPGKTGPFVSLKGMNLNKTTVYENLVYEGVNARIKIAGDNYAD